jgi:hypothetical protein
MFVIINFKNLFRYDLHIMLYGLDKKEGKPGEIRREE